MRIFFVIIAMAFVSATTAAAEKINLKNGRSIDGKVIEMNTQRVKVNVNGTVMTYWADEVKDIDGVAMPVPVPSVKKVAMAPSEKLVTGKPSSLGGISVEKRELILKFMDAFGTSRALDKNFELMMEQVAKEKPQEAEDFRARVKVNELIEQLIPLYDQYFTEEDLNGYIAFYNSPLGHKLLATIPQIMQESVEVSLRYMQDKFPEEVPLEK